MSNGSYNPLGLVKGPLRSARCCVVHGRSTMAMLSPGALAGRPFVDWRNASKPSGRDASGGGGDRPIRFPAVVSRLFCVFVAALDERDSRRTSGHANGQSHVGYKR